MNELHQLLKEIGKGRMSSVAYDTAWVARLGDVDWELSNQALNWLCEHQLPDGSWGAEKPFYYHDRVISTLAVMISLSQRGRRMMDKKMVERGLIALERITSGATRGLQADPNGATVGFEMIAPTLVTEAEELGIIKQQGDSILGRLGKLRARKMEKLAGLLHINKHVTPAFSAEMVGKENPSIIDVDNILEMDGSVGHSPSATAYYLIQHRSNDRKALSYLKHWTDDTGGVPNFAPIDVFEISWTLWNLGLHKGLIDDKVKRLLVPHLNTLTESWCLGEGIGTAAQCTIKDSDDSGLVADVLQSFNRQADIQTLLSFEEEEHFRCFELEANPSISANIHVLGALKQAGFEKQHPSVNKLIRFLRKNQSRDGYWLDKWHASPYYVTSHAIIMLIGYDNDMVQKAIDWIVRTQKANGSWGFYEISTSEETAYCLQALSIWEKNGGKVSKAKIRIGSHWLKANRNMYIPLWIGKALYCPARVVDSTVLSAISLTESE